MGDVRIDKAFDLTQGIEAWYRDEEEKNLEQFKRNRSTFVSGINDIIIKAQNQQMTADLTGLLENVQRTAETFALTICRRGATANQTEKNLRQSGGVLFRNPYRLAIRMFSKGWAIDYGLAYSREL